MTTLISDAYINALLADATYALDETTPNGLNGDDLKDALSQRMTPTLAQYISDNYSVITHIETNDLNPFETGFDATVWKKTTGPDAGKIYVSMRGTNPGVDMSSADLDLTLFNGAPTRQIVDMVNWWLRITTPTNMWVKQIAVYDVPVSPADFFYETDPVMGEGIAELINSPMVTVNGHSLGGALATAFTALFDGSTTTIVSESTFNSAGFGLFHGAVFSQLKSLLGFSGSNTYDNTNYFAENGLSVTTREFFNTQFGDRVALSQEDSASGIPNHYMYKITDLLALGNLLYTFDASFDFEMFNKIVDAGANETGASYESVLDGLRKLFGLYVDPTSLGDVDKDADSRKEYHANISLLQAALTTGSLQTLINNVLIIPWDDQNTSGKTDYGQFLSLYFLTPFALDGNETILKTLRHELYTLWEQDKELTAEDRKDGKANFSDSWYTDRTAMLAAQNSRNVADTPVDETTNHGEKNIYFLDVPSDASVFSQVQSAGSGSTQFYKFGDAVESNELDGGYYDDHIYGGSQNDILKGHEGDDILVGGKGADQLEGGIGDDTLKAIDGATTDTLIGGQGDDSYYIDFIDNNTDTIIENANEGFDTVYVTGEDYVLQENFEKLVLLDKSDSTAATPSTEKLTGNAADNTIVGNRGNNIIMAAQGADEISGGKGNDRLDGGTGNDVYLFARGDGHDFISDTDMEDVNNVDTIRFAADIAPSDVRFWNDGATVYLNIPSTGDVIAMPWRFNQRMNDEENEAGGWGSGGGYYGTLWTSSYFPYTATWGAYTTHGSTNYWGGSSASYLSHYMFVNFDHGYDGAFPYEATQYNFGWDPFASYDIFQPITPDVILDQEGRITLGANRYLYKPDGSIWISAQYSDYYDVNSYHTFVQGTKVSSYSPDFYAVEKVEFADGTVWDLKERADIGERSDNPYPDDWNWGDAPVVVTNDAFEGGDGDDTTSTGAGADSLNGRKGNDILNGGSGNDVYLFAKGDGRDTIKDYDNSPGNIDIIRFAADVLVADVTAYRDTNNLYLKNTTNNDVITIENWFTNTSYRVEQVEFADGTVWDVNYFSDLKYIGSADADNLSGTNSNEYFEALSGDDVISAGAGNDTLDGGTGNDQLDGGIGSDIYLFAAGDGQDSIDDFSSVAGQTDIVRFASGILPSDVIAYRDTYNLYLKIGSNGDLITINNWFTSADYRIEKFEFSNGTVWNAAALTNIKYAGTTGDDIISSGVGNDILEGGKGNDQLSGGAGNDLYLFARGDGQDTINDYDTTVSNSDTIRFAADINPSDILVWRDASNLYLNIQNTEDVLTVSNWFTSTDYRVENIEFANGTVWTANNLITAKFRGTATSDQLYGTAENNYLEALADNDYISAGEGADTLDGGAGNDELDGGIGNDLYLFARGDGQDTITDYDATTGNLDVIRFAADIVPADVVAYRDATNLYLSINNSADLISVTDWFTDPTSRVEQVEFANGTVWTATQLSAVRFRGTAGDDQMDGGTGSDYFESIGGNDVLAGNAGNDTLDGGTGNDYLDGGVGNDLYLFARGDGQDTVTDYDTTAGNTDTVRFASDVLPTDVVAYRDAANLYLSINGTSDVITITDWFTSTGNRVEKVEFANGTTWTATQLLAARFRGTTGNDQLYGTTGNDYLEGIAGNDDLYGDAGNDTLDGGTGNDNLSGDAGNDIYLIGRGSGQDIITEAAGTDSIQFAPDVVPADVDIWRDTSNLYVAIVGATDVVTISGWFDATTNRVESLKFSDGTTWATSVLLAARFQGTNGNDYIYGTTGNDVIAGIGGNDGLYGDTGNDTLDGGTGNDTLSGDAGNDIYLVGAGDGQDVVTEPAGTTDIIRFKAGVLPSDVLVSRDTANLYFTILSTGDKITIQNHYGDTNARIERVEFSDTTNWDLTAINAKMAAGSAGADFLWGTAGNDTFNGLDGNDQLIGNDGNDNLAGGAGNDLLDGGLGSDTLLGGLGDDTYIVDVSTDIVTENASEGNDTVNSTVTYVLGATLENLTLTGATAINGTGNTSNNILIGNDQVNQLLGDAGDDILLGAGGNDTLTGGVGADSLLGGAGNDTYVIDADDTVTELAGEGTDTIQAGFDYILGTNFENLTLTGTASLNGTGNSLNNALVGNSGANTLISYAGNDTLNGGAGADILIGGIGNDTYTVDNVGDVVTENANEGTDTVSSSITYTLGTNLENLTLTGSGVINGTGNAFNNTLIGNSAVNTLIGGDGNDSLDGGTGADTLTGGTGNDTYVIDNAGDAVTENTGEGTDLVKSSITYTLGNNLENLTLTGAAVINGTGNTLDNILIGNGVANTLTGGAGNDTLDGAAGTDTLIGGTGDDIYVVDATADVITEVAGEGIDSVNASATYTLASNIENLTLTGSTAINGTGNASANIITGNSAINTLDGGTGADTMVGGAGDDIYVVDNTGDVVTEFNNEGIDLVQSSITYTLSSNVEKLTLTGTTAINATGNSLANTLTGNSGNNVLDGGAGIDTLVGGAGNDTYIVDDSSDVITESSSAGTDTVQSSASYTLASNVENLTLTGTASINATGNTLANILVGNSAANILDGGTGADTMSAGAGDDTYVVDNVGDVVTENASEGIDLVKSSIAYTLGNNVENLMLTGSTAINGTGNTLDNLLTGNSGINTLTGGAGNDTLNGAAGADTLIGGTGDDTYIVDNVSDVVTEATGEGVDTINSSVVYTLSANVENLTLTGTSGLAGTGNTLDNILIGNTGANSLVGNEGNDQLNGGAGNDTLTGGIGNDTYIFGRGYGVDTVVENDSTVDNSDVVQLGADITVDQVWFKHTGNNLELTIVGTTDKLVLSNWYSGTANHVEQIKTSNGMVLLDSQIEALVSAMASFAPPVGVGGVISQQTHDQLQPVLAASWHAS